MRNVKTCTTGWRPDPKGFKRIFMQTFTNALVKKCLIFLYFATALFEESIAVTIFKLFIILTFVFWVVLLEKRSRKIF